jgi:hypothetical protein
VKDRDTSSLHLSTLRRNERGTAQRSFAKVLCRFLIVGDLQVAEFETTEQGQVTVCLKSLNERVTVTISAIIDGSIRELTGIVSSIESLAESGRPGWRITIIET